MRSRAARGLLVACLAATLAASGPAPAETVRPPLPLGDCTSEPALAGRTDIVFCEPFESPEWWRNGYEKVPRLSAPIPVRPEHLAHTVLEEEGCVSGRCLRVTMRQLETGALSIHWPLRAAGLEPEQLAMRYYLRLGPTWDTTACARRGDQIVKVDEGGGKFPGLADPRDADDPGGQCGNGGRRSDGRRCWTHRMGYLSCAGKAGSRACGGVPGAIARIGGYVYFPGQKGPYGVHASWHDDASRLTPKAWRRREAEGHLQHGRGRAGVLVRERWYAIELFIRMNTPGRADGIVRGWVDGVLAYEKTDMVLRLPGHENLHVRTAWLDVYKGGEDGNCQDGDVWLDQLVLATDGPVGPRPAAAAGR